MSRTRMSADDAYLALQEQIVRGELKPGARLREVEVAEMLGMSRTPVREAFHRLKAEGLVTQEPNKGVLVRQLDYASIAELYHIREVLEGSAAALAAQHMSDVELTALRAMIPAQKAACDEVAKASALNKTFHRTIAHGARNRYLIDMIGGLDLSMALLGRSTLDIDSRKQEALAEHEALLDAMEARDPKTAEAVARQHIRSAHAARLTILSESWV